MQLMLQDFKKFVTKGNVLDLAVAVILEIAFGLYMVVCILISLWYGFGYSTIPFLMIFAGGYFYVGFSSVYVLWRMNREAEEAALALEAAEPVST